MVRKEIQIEELFSSKEVAKKLDIADVTVRKYSQMLNNLANEELFHFEGNKRMYANSDYIALRELIFLKDSTAMSLDSIITDIYIKYYERYKTVSESDTTESASLTVANDDIKLIYEELKLLRKEMALMREENNEMREIINQKAIEQKEEEKQQEQQATKEENQSDEKKGFWKRLFS